MGDAVQIVDAVQQAWAEAFARRDIAGLSGLYAEDAAFYGSTAPLYRGREGVTAYFSGLPSRYRQAEFGQGAATVLAPDVIAWSGAVRFAVEQGQWLPYRMTHVLVQRQGQWRIAVHHASPTPD